MLSGMNSKDLRHFLCGLLCGALGMHWYAVSAQETFELFLRWLERTAEEYRAEHPAVEVNTGWHSRGRGN